MAPRWSVLGFLGSILLLIYGLLYFSVFHLSEALVASFSASILSGFLGILAGIGGILVSVGFLHFQVELQQSLAWLATLIGVVTWGFLSAAHFLLAAGLVLGGALYSGAYLGMIFTFILWGISWIYASRKMVMKGQYAFYVGLLYVMNAIIWMIYLGFAVLALISLLSAIVLVPSDRIGGLPSPVRFFTKKRQYQLGQLGLLFLTIFSLLATRWLIDQIFPLPVVVAAALNMISLFSAWFAILGIAIVFSKFEVHFGNRLFGYAQIIGIPSLLLLSLADFTWLMSNIHVTTDFSRALVFYLQAPSFWALSAIPLALWALLGAIGFLQLLRSPEKKGDILILVLNLLFLTSTVLWVLGFGYIPLIIAGLLLFLVFSQDFGILGK